MVRILPTVIVGVIFIFNCLLPYWQHYFYRPDDRGMILLPISYATWVLGWFNEPQPRVFPVSTSPFRLFVYRSAIVAEWPRLLSRFLSRFLSRLRRASSTLSSCFSFTPVLPLCCYLTSPILRTLRHPHNYALRVPWLEKRIPQLTFTLLADGKQHPSGLPLVAPVLRPFLLLSPLYHNCSLVRKHIGNLGSIFVLLFRSWKQ